MGGYRVVNLGCKVNRADADAFERIMEDAHLSRAPEGDADIVIANTCTVTGAADKKARKTVRAVLRQEPHARVLVTGCSSMRSPGTYESMSERITVVPIGSMNTVLENALSGISGTDGGSSRRADPVHDPRTDGSGLRVRKGVKVQDGCDGRCTYCVIWKARGNERSMSIEEIEDGVRRACEEGAREVMLTGINLGRYSHGGYDLASLLERLIGLGYPCRYRVSSVEPLDVTGDLIDVLARSDGSVCRHLHIPMQSGSTKVLEEMGRPYSAEDFAELVSRLRSRIPSISISTDVISGFPGETEDDHRMTLEMIRECMFSRVHAFPFSAREGTPAAERPDQIDPLTRARRSREVRDAGSSSGMMDLASRAGTTELAVVESEDSCMTDSYHELEPPEGAEPGQIIEVRMDGKTVHPSDTEVPVG